MTQIGEAIHAVFGKDEPEKDPNKDPIKIRIALFYDGTLNNRKNIEDREASEFLAMKSDDAATRERRDGAENQKKAAIYEKNRDPKGGPTSYDNGRTNINIMEAQVMDTADGYDYYLKFYIEGQGTFDDKRDSFLGYSMGTLSSGVPARAKKGIQTAIDALPKLLISKPPQEWFIEECTIDVFGFSRGAATARHSIHQMIKSTLRPMYARLRSIGYGDTKKSAVKVCFAGLYDTVLSYWVGQYLHTQWGLDMQAVTEAEKVIHLCAADEHRIDFPISNIKSAKEKGNGEEYFLPGVHSDIGGSYNMALDLELQKDLAEDKKELMKTSDEIERVINKGDPDWLDEDRKNLITLGWYRENEIAITDTVLAILPDIGSGSPGMPAHGMLKVTRAGIHSSYCNIPLKIMAEFAEKKGVKILPKLRKIADKILSGDADLMELERNINSYVASGTKRSSSADWLSDPSLKSIRHKHFHFSSKVGTGYNPRFGADGITRTRYIVDA